MKKTNIYKTTASWHLTQFWNYPVNKDLGSGTKGTGHLRWEGNLNFHRGLFVLFEFFILCKYLLIL